MATSVTIKLMSGEGAEHNLVIPDFNVDSGHVVGQGKTVSVTFGVDRPGSFAYYCDLAGHRQAGMEGALEVAGDSARREPPARGGADDRDAGDGYGDNGYGDGGRPGGRSRRQSCNRGGYGG